MKNNELYSLHEMDKFFEEYKSPKLKQTKNNPEPKIKIDELYFIKINNFCSSKNTIKKSNGQMINWKKIFSIFRSEKGLTSRIYH